MAIPAEILSRAHAIALTYSAIPSVEAVVLSGSQTAGTSVTSSDIDLYVYSRQPVALDERSNVAMKHSRSAELNNQFWEPGDEWIDKDLNVGVDVMFRSPDWIESQLHRILKQHEASVGYSTCFWQNVLMSKILFDRNEWFFKLQEGARVPYPDELRGAVVAKNYPILRKNQSSYRNQIVRAIERNDLVSVTHRITALLASYFDILFAVNRLPHPGEKRLLDVASEGCANKPEQMVSAVESVIRNITCADERLIRSLDSLLDELDTLLQKSGLLP